MDEEKILKTVKFNVMFEHINTSTENVFSNEIIIT